MYTKQGRNAAYARVQDTCKIVARRDRATGHIYAATRRRAYTYVFPRTRWRPRRRNATVSNIPGMWKLPGRINCRSDRWPTNRVEENIRSVSGFSPPPPPLPTPLFTTLPFLFLPTVCTWNMFRAQPRTRSRIVVFFLPLSSVLLIKPDICIWVPIASRVRMWGLSVCGITDPYKSPIKAERRDDQQRQFSDDFR